MMVRRSGQGFGESGLSRGGPLPLYHQIANVIRSEIQSGEWERGECIPAESYLAGRFYVTHATVRQALGVLVNEGLLERRHGRGTFVMASATAPESVRLTVPFEGITAAMAPLAVRLMDVVNVRGPAWVLRALRAESGEVVRVRRIRLANRRPVSYAITYLPKWLGDALDPQALKEPLLIDALEREAHVRFSEAEQTIEASLADPEAAAALAVAIGAPILLVRRIYQLASGETAYAAVNRYASDLFRYKMRLTRQSHDRILATPDTKLGGAGRQCVPDSWAAEITGEEHHD